jgi:phospholipid/cholesterol/gamma-HCH transport system substrate-binding protein
VSNPVQVDGVSIGRVQKIELVQGQTDRIIVTLEVDHNVRLYYGTKAFIASTGLLSDKAIKLEIPRPTEKIYLEHDTLFGGIEEDIMSKVTAKAEPLIANLDSVSRELKVMLRGFQKTRTLLDATLTNTGKATQEADLMLAENRPALRRTLNNAASLTASLAGTQRSLDGLLKQFDNLADSLKDARIAQTVQNLNRTVNELNGVMTDVNSGKGTLGKLAKNDSLYNNLNKSSSDLDALLQDVKARPGRYIHISVFGKKPQP